MSGGYFNYDQCRIGQIAESIDRIARQENHQIDCDDFQFDFNEKTLVEFRNAVIFLKLAQIYAHRIDWLVSGDDGEDTFHKRLAEDLKEVDTLQREG